MAPPMKAIWLLAALTATALAGLARAAQCDVDDDVDYRGSDINNGKDNVVGSARACCDSCAQNSRCESWTYVKRPSELGTGRQVGECWLKTGFKPGFLRSDCCTSGVVQSGCATETNFDYRGSDINDGTQNVVSSPEACCDACGRNSRCVSWTYVKEPSALGTGRKVGECWLKNVFKPGRQSNTCCTSGVV